MCYWSVCVCACKGQVKRVKPYNINEYISRLINKLDSSAPREAYYLLARVDFFPFFFFFGDRFRLWQVTHTGVILGESARVEGRTFFFSSGLKKFLSDFGSASISEQMAPSEVKIEVTPLKLSSITSHASILSAVVAYNLSLQGGYHHVLFLSVINTMQWPFSLGNKPPAQFSTQKTEEKP